MGDGYRVSIIESLKGSYVLSAGIEATKWHSKSKASGRYYSPFALRALKNYDM